MGEKVEVPYPVNREEQYLAAILGELRAIHAMLAPPVAEKVKAELVLGGPSGEDDLFGDEVELKEQKEG